MAIRFNCPHCWYAFAVPDEYAGGQGRCENCGMQVRIPKPKPQVASSQPTSAMGKKRPQSHCYSVAPRNSPLGEDRAKARGREMTDQRHQRQSTAVRGTESTQAGLGLISPEGKITAFGNFCFVSFVVCMLIIVCKFGEEISALWDSPPSQPAQVSPHSPASNAPPAAPQSSPERRKCSICGAPAWGKDAWYCLPCQKIESEKTDQALRTVRELQDAVRRQKVEDYHERR